MKVLHLAPHLGGGVGKAHAAMAEAAMGLSPRAAIPVHHDYALLEPPRDLGYADRIRKAGCALHIAPELDQLAALAADADIVQVEWWNHPRLYNLLVTNRLPDMRLVTWLHISGLVIPLVPPSLVALADQTLFTSPCSFGAENLRAAILDRPQSFGVVNSGFGLDDPADDKRRVDAPLRFGYLGTLDFLKMHPDFFDFVDAVEPDIRVHLWGRYDRDGDVAKRAAAMRFPNRIRFEGYTSDPAQVLSQLDVFIYLLAPDHYGTAENALVEAMSTGVVPIVFANPAESYIVKNRQTGYVVDSRTAFVSIIESLIRDPGQLVPIRSAARAEVSRHFSPTLSVLALHSVYDDVMRQPKRRRDFAAALGRDARAWFLSSLSTSESADLAGARLLSHVASKGSLGHFRSCFPQDKSLETLGRRAG